jgi:transcriptional regulator with XRE-family HTH domain
MTFGQTIRSLRKARNLSQRDLAGKVKVNYSYISKIENEKLDFADYPSEELILTLARALEADADELLLLAKKIPESVRKRVIQRPDVFRRLALLDDEALDRLMRTIDGDLHVLLVALDPDVTPLANLGGQENPPAS